VAEQAAALQRTSLTRLIVALFAIACLHGCVAPGSSTGRLAVAGELVDPDGNAVADEEVQIVLPADYGLGGLDLVLNEPTDFKQEDQSFVLVTDSRGMFEQNLGYWVYHMDFWLLPPLGGFPKRPPPPLFLIRFPERGDEVYAVQTWNGKLQVVDSLGVVLDSELAPVRLRSAKNRKWDDQELGLSGTRSEIGFQIRE